MQRFASLLFLTGGLLVLVGLFTARSDPSVLFLGLILLIAGFVVRSVTTPKPVKTVRRRSHDGSRPATPPRAVPPATTAPVQFNPWTVLEVAPAAPAIEIKRAYYRKVRKHPPDRDPEGFKLVRAAYEALGAPR